MVAKGKYLRIVKNRKVLERQNRSLCVKVKSRSEKPVVEAAVMGIHDGIEKVYFPRQKIPRFFFVLCKSSDLKEEVKKSIRKFKHETIGTLIPKDARIQQPIQESLSKHGAIDAKVIVIEGISGDLKTEILQQHFPKAIETHRFNDKRCYLHFNNAEDAFDAYEKLSTTPVDGIQLKAKFFKVSS